MNNYISPIPFLLANKTLSENNILLTLLLILLSMDLFWLKNYFRRLFSNLTCYFIISKKNKIEFNCSEIKSVYSCKNIKMSASDAFKALCYYIKLNDKNNNVCHLFSIKELTCGLYDYDSEESSNKLKEIIYIPNQCEKFNILNEQDKDIDFELQKVDLTNGDSNTNIKADGVSSFSNYKLILSSSKRDTSYLQKYIDNICKIYYQAIDDQILNNNYVFIFEGTDNDGQLSFSSYPFNTTCNIDNFFLKNKEKLINQIDFFLKNKDWYKQKGKPYTLGICTWGYPGCGKTTFEKIITKYTNRHMIIVDISKIRTQKEADQLFFSEKINNIKIPYDKRLYVFPDVDRMSEIIKDKKLDKYSEKNINKSSIIEDQSGDEDELDDLSEIEKKLSSKLLKIIKNNNKSQNLTYLPENYNLNKGSSPLTMSKLLNILDGIPERTGQIIMMSCNNPEQLDKAFLRPGRIDILAEFTKMSHLDLINLLENHFNQKLSNQLNDDEIILINEKWTPAEVFKVCSQFKDINSSYKILKNEDPNKIIYPFG